MLYWAYSFTAMVNDQLKEYIRTAQGQGRSQDDLYRELLAQGWSVADIQAAQASLTSHVRQEDTQKRTVRIIVGIGAVLVAAGIFSFIAANWQGMTPGVKVAVIVFFLLLADALGWVSKETYGYQKTGEALYLLGALIYGAGIFLVAQIFNIHANWPDGFLLWMIGACLLGWAVDSYWLLGFALLPGLVAVIGYPFGIFTGFAYNSFLLTSSWLLLVTTLVSLATGWFIRRKMPAEAFEQL